MSLSRVSDTVVLTKSEYTTVWISDEAAAAQWRDKRFDLVELFGASYFTENAYRATKIRIEVRES